MNASNEIESNRNDLRYIQNEVTQFARNIRLSKMHGQQPKLESAEYKAQRLSIVLKHNLSVTFVKINIILMSVSTNETVVFNAVPSTSADLASNDKQSSSINIGRRRQSV
jgi:hypothetical protein